MPNTVVIAFTKRPITFLPLPVRLKNAFPQAAGSIDEARQPRPNINATAQSAPSCEALKRGGVFLFSSLPGMHTVNECLLIPEIPGDKRLRELSAYLLNRVHYCCGKTGFLLYYIISPSLRRHNHGSFPGVSKANHYFLSKWGYRLWWSSTTSCDRLKYFSKRLCLTVPMCCPIH